VAYLNTQGEDFEGGTFCFQSGDPPLRFAPSAGMLLLHTAGERNTHSVEEVTGGQRCTLTMWFTLDAEHQEDAKASRVGLPVVACLCVGVWTRGLLDGG
jgi:predicted 2-oxoglutarate/Fe(II)-dependent dioxygenase YbiX